MPSGKVLPAPTQGNGLAEGNSAKLLNQRSPCWLTGGYSSSHTELKCALLGCQEQQVREMLHALETNGN